MADGVLTARRGFRFSAPVLRRLMYKNRQTELPARIRSLVSVRNAFAAVACLAVFLGLLASFDAIAERFFAPDAVTSVLPAKTFPLSSALRFEKAFLAARRSGTPFSKYCLLLPLAFTS